MFTLQQNDNSLDVYHIKDHICDLIKRKESHVGSDPNEFQVMIVKRMHRAFRNLQPPCQNDFSLQTYVKFIYITNTELDKEKEPRLLIPPRIMAVSAMEQKNWVDSGPCRTACVN